MELLDGLIVLVLFLILIVIVFNLLSTSRDLATFPRKEVKLLKETGYYPGSIRDFYYTDDESDDDDDSSDDSGDNGSYDDNYYYNNKKSHRKKGQRPNPKKIAKYVANRLPQ